jgi:cytochrome c biogenesis protein CcmG/thiol:disulfide interchange protein DsbE
MNWRRAVVAALLVVPPLLLLARGFGTDPHALPSMLVGRPAPLFTLTSLEGAKLSLAELRGTPVVLNFWSSWCEPCKVEHALLQRTAEQLADRVRFLGVVYQDTPDNARGYLQERGSTYPNLLDPGALAAIDYGISGVPETFFIGADGKVAHKQVGLVSASILTDQLRLLGVQ